MADREALDLLTGDMAGHQEKTGKLPTPGENQALAGELFERLDRKAGEKKPAIVADPPEVKHIGDLSHLDCPPLGQPIARAPSAVELKAKEKGYRLLRGDNAPHVVPVKLSSRALEMHKKITARVKLLMSKEESGVLGAPSWRDQVLAVQSLQFTGRTEKEVAAVSKAFGPKVAAIHAARGGRASAAVAILKVLDESSAVFGDWWVDAPKKVMIG